jgi:hypothetical protein
MKCITVYTGCALLGATEFLHHCPVHRPLYKKLKRRLTDIDVVTYSTLSEASHTGERPSGLLYRDLFWILAFKEIPPEY